LEDFRESGFGLSTVETNSEEGHKEGLHLGGIMSGESADSTDDFIKEIGLLDVDFAEGVDNFNEFIASKGSEDTADISEDVVVDGGVSGVEVSESLEGLDNFRGVHSLVEIVVVGDEFSDDGNVEFVVLSDILRGDGLEDVGVQLLVTKVQEALDGFNIQVSGRFKELSGESQSGGKRSQDSLGTSFREVLLEGFQLLVDFSDNFFAFEDGRRGSLENISKELGASVKTFIAGLGFFIDLSGIFSSEEIVVDQVCGEHEFEVRRDGSIGGFIDFVGLLGNVGSDLRSDAQGVESLDETVDALESDIALILFHNGQELEEESVEFGFESVEFIYKFFIILKTRQDLSEGDLFVVGVFNDVGKQEGLIEVDSSQREEGINQSLQFLLFNSSQVFLDPGSPEKSSLLVADGKEHVFEEVRVVDLTLLSLQAFSSSFNDFGDSSISAGGFREALNESEG
jgi:hypothetical protein